MPTLRDLLPSYSELSPQAQLDLILRLRMLRKTRAVRASKGRAKSKAKTLSPPPTKANNTKTLTEAFLRIAQLPEDIKQQVLERMGLEGEKP